MSRVFETEIKFFGGYDGEVLLENVPLKLVKQISAKLLLKTFKLFYDYVQIHPPAQFKVFCQAFFQKSRVPSSLILFKLSSYCDYNRQYAQKIR